MKVSCSSASWTSSWRRRRGVARAVRDEDVLRRHLETLERPVLVADELAEPAITLGVAVREGLRPLGLHHPCRGLDHVVVGERGRVRIATAELVERTGDGTGGRDRGAPSDQGTARQEVLEAGGRGSCHERRIRQAL